MTLLEQLDRACPTWRLDYGPDPMAAALELGLIDELDVTRATEYRPVNLHDEKQAWARVSEQWDEEHEDYDDEG